MTQSVTTHVDDTLRRYVAGDHSAFAEVVQCERDVVYGFLMRLLGNNRHLADDVFQETMLSLYVNRGSFDPSRPLRPWLLRIAANKVSDARRQFRRRRDNVLMSDLTGGDYTDDEMMDSRECDEQDPLHGCIESEEACEIRRAISRMAPKYREVLFLAYFRGRTYAQISGILGIPVGTVKSRLHTAVSECARHLTRVRLC